MLHVGVRKCGRVDEVPWLHGDGMGQMRYTRNITRQMYRHNTMCAEEKKVYRLVMPSCCRYVGLHVLGCSHTRKSATQLLSCWLMGPRHASKQARHSTEPYPLHYALARHADANEPNSTFVSWKGDEDLKFSAASHKSPMQSRSGVGKHVRRGAQQLSPFVSGHLQQGTGGDMLHVGKAYYWVLLENGSGSAKASMSE